MLRHLLVEPQWPIHSKGVRLRGARISGRLDLESATVRCPLLLEDCYLDSSDPVVLDYATIPRIVLSRCRVVGGLAADLLVVTKELDLSGSAFEGVVRLIAADITGQLVLRGAAFTGRDGDGNALVGDVMKVGAGVLVDQGFTAAGAVRLFGADVTGQLICRGAKLTGTDRDGNALSGERMKVSGGVFFDQGFTAAGAVRLPGADITGQLICRGAKLTGRDGEGYALFGDGMKVSGGVVFDRGFTAAGAVRLFGADVTGQLICRGAKLTGRDGQGNALVGDGMKVSGDVLLDQGFSAVGAVRLPNTDITGPLTCSGAKLTGTDGYGNALVGDGMKVGGSVFLDKEFTAAGAVRLPETNITGSLTCRSAKLTGTDVKGNALVGDGMRVSRSVFLDKEFSAAGAVSVDGARIGGSLSLDGAELAKPIALQASGVRIGGQLEWAPRSPVRGLVDLERAAVHRLDDDWSVPDAHWPPAGHLRLAGFTYDGFGGYHRASWRQRLDWIRRSHTTATGTAPAVFAGQPYEQLARVYRQIGHESQARQVAIARRNDVRRYGSLTRPREFGNWLLDKTIRHGYQALRAVGLLVAVYAAVLLVFWGAQHQDRVVVPAKDTRTITPVPTALHCSPAYPCFYPAGYAVDVVVPIINLRQAESWRPDGHAPWGWAYLTVGWVATGLGWAFTTLAVAGYTGLVHRD